MFTTDEARALAVATRIAQQWLDPALALAAGLLLLGQGLDACRLV
jgi:predicted DNA-binding transcriptional regulator YafY